MRKLIVSSLLGLALASPAAPAAASSCTPKQISGRSCKPFLNQARTLRHVRATLLGNGFYSAGLRVTVVSPQKITYRGIQDGEPTWGEVFKTGDRQLWISFSTVGYGRSHLFNTSFVA